MRVDGLIFKHFMDIRILIPYADRCGERSLPLLRQALRSVLNGANLRVIWDKIMLGFSRVGVIFAH